MSREIIPMLSEKYGIKVEIKGSSYGPYHVVIPDVGGDYPLSSGYNRRAVITRADVLIPEILAKWARGVAGDALERLKGSKDNEGGGGCAIQ